MKPSETKMQDFRKRLKIGVVGLGQCGGNLASEFVRKGYQACALNTSFSDLKSSGGTTAEAPSPCGT